MDNTRLERTKAIQKKSAQLSHILAKIAKIDAVTAEPLIVASFNVGFDSKFDVLTDHSTFSDPGHEGINAAAASFLDGVRARLVKDGLAVSIEIADLTKAI